MDAHIWDRLLAALDNPFGAAGLMGNLYAESALNPRNLQQSCERKLGYTDESYTAAVDTGSHKNFVHDGAGYGLAQWTYHTRKAKLLTFARARGTSIGDLDMQLDFLIEEIKNYTGVWSALINATYVREASDAVLTGYEKPTDQSEAVRIKRAAYGKKYYDLYAKEGNTVQNYDKYILSKSPHYISNSGKDENNTYHGGKAGDQTGHEWELKAWYPRPWTVVLRWEDITVALLIARLSCAAALNDKIGYDQWQRNTYWAELQKAGYDPSKIATACEEDCTAGVSANVKAAGALLGIKALQKLPLCSSRNMRQEFVAAGFKALTASKYLTGPDYLLPGDILLYESHHAAANVSYGVKVWPEGGEIPDTPIPAPVEGLRRGDYGSAVTAMQQALLTWRPECLPKWGADGDFGGETEVALRAYQAEAGLPVTGVYDEATRKALTAAGSMPAEPATPEPEPPEPDPPEGPAFVLATADVNVRSAPGTDARIIGVLKKGYTAPYQEVKQEWGGRDWYLIEFNGENGWVSSRYSEVTVG